MDLIKYIWKKSWIEDKPYQIIDQFNERKIISTKFYSILLKKYIYFMMEMVERVRYCLIMMI